MLNFYYKTRGEERSLQNIPSQYPSLEEKPKLYFACHSNDFEACFTELSKDLLEKWDVVIWFDHSADTEKSKWELQTLQDFLQDVQILVLAVTPALLETTCQAWQIEYTFAKEHHIPILPIVPSFVGVAQGLASRFSTLTDKLHLLNKNISKELMSSAIPYEQKLLDFLSHTLLSQNQIETIRQEFTARCFLSYRKVDRDFAKALMSYIHQFPQFQDVAIWFDEYLYAGENYNEQIQRNLTTADVVLLLVTPNIYAPNAKGEDNFVVTHEYKDAMRSSRRIFPVLVTPAEELDFSILQEKFPALPPCIDVRETSFQQQLAHALFSVLPSHPEPSTPEHLYQIGLAYLYGVDVEKDHERAVKLILQAADAGLSVSVKDLIYMYRTGKGVARNMAEAIRLQEVLAKHYQQSYYQQVKQVQVLPEKLQEYYPYSDFYQWTITLWLLGNDQLELGDYQGALKSYHQMLENCQMFLQMGVFHRQLIEQFAFLPVALDNLGDVSLRNNEPKQAMCYYEEALNYNLLCCKSNESTTNLEHLSISYNRMGDACQNLGYLEKAVDYYQKERQIVKKLCKTEPSLRFYRILAQGYLRMGGLLMEQKDEEEAEKELLEGIRQIESVYHQTQSTDDLQILSVGFQSLGFLYLHTHRFKESEEWLLHAYQARKKLLEENYDFQNKMFLIETCHTLASLYLTIQKLKIAGNYETTVIELAEELMVKDMANQYRLTYLEDYKQMTNLFLEQQQPLLAVDALLALIYYEQQLIERGYENYHQQHAKSYALLEDLRIQIEQLAEQFGKKGTSYYNQQHFSEAISQISYAIICLEKLCQIKNSDAYLVRLAQHHTMLGDMRAQDAEAEQDYRTALSIVETLVKRDPSHAVLLMITSKATADICIQQDHLQDADEVLQKAIEKLQELYQQTQNTFYENLKFELINIKIPIQMKLWGLTLG